MNERLKELARQAKPSPNLIWEDAELERFAQLVRDDEREACAELCEKTWKQQALRHYAALTYSQAANNCADAIRARGEK
jgi:hypothetical protein